MKKKFIEIKSFEIFSFEILVQFVENKLTSTDRKKCARCDINLSNFRILKKKEKKRGE